MCVIHLAQSDLNKESILRTTLAQLNSPALVREVRGDQDFFLLNVGRGRWGPKGQYSV